MHVDPWGSGSRRKKCMWIHGDPDPSHCMTCCLRIYMTYFSAARQMVPQVSAISSTRIATRSLINKKVVRERRRKIIQILLVRNRANNFLSLIV